MFVKIVPILDLRRNYWVIDTPFRTVRGTKPLRPVLLSTTCTGLDVTSIPNTLFHLLQVVKISGTNLTSLTHH